jgi:hypothetical protein
MRQRRLFSSNVSGAVTLACAMLFAPGPALSADFGPAPAPVAPASQWRLSFTPYAWYPWLQGDMTVKGRSINVDVNPIQVLEHLERVPFFGYGEARNGPIALYSDVFYANLGLTGEGVRSRTLASGITGTLSAAVGLDFEEAVVEVGGAYEIMKWDSHTAIDILAGARYWHQEGSLNLALAGTLDAGDLVISGNRAIARSGSVDWVDPLVGGRIRYNLAPGQDLILRGDVGGFGVGSQFSWNTLAAYSFAFAKRDGVTYSGLLGYRALSADYEQGSGRTKYVYDVVMHGPVTGLTIGF